ncbi:hypothetical protein ENUP19_0082G0100 [Entamoeba nuttalli]|uniref:Uncharacterized protein n=1 Tax=Entamoeba nuttalli TaxID=412467 RepID=A0ABQ0DFQ6_9EUKA
MEYKVCLFGFEHSGVRSLIHRLITGNFSGSPVVFKEEYVCLSFNVVPIERSTNVNILAIH